MNVLELNYIYINFRKAEDSVPRFYNKFYLRRIRLSNFTQMIVQDLIVFEINIGAHTDGHGYTHSTVAANQGNM